ncbi:helix-hairpin-helix domain-containing protein [Pedobacter caeni]|uniref:Helix-hairpin-helix motif-containing protein n=1 Tax=Pedobacter caeni TaxID=288992 RepID=A0A1M5J4J9_9SPHI|nr:helix-hairpin-helix domain-containing protein [Pedobacter caeni]SHG35239.1 Helix-hairpin-helix motif-containing protein [Pedobacter caeni]
MVPASLRLFFFLILIFPGSLLFAQEEEQVKDLKERLAENGNEEEELAELTDQLDFFRKHPIDLNHTRPEELKKLIFLSPLQISNFFQHLSVNGKLLDLLELQSIPDFDPETIDKLLPFVTLNPVNPYANLSWNNLYRKGNHQVMLRYGRLLQQQKGFTSLPGSRYLGSPDKLLFRYKYQYADLLSASLVMKKDAGETLFSGKPAIDFLSGNLAIYKFHRLSKLIIGDYSLQFGQGLTLWSGFSLGKGPDVTSVASKDVGLKSYTSTSEGAFFRGIAATVHLSGHFYLSPFFSFRKRDASLKIWPDGSLTLSTINESGLHRTQTELRNRKTLNQQLYGFAFQYLAAHFSAGLVAYQSRYGYSFSNSSPPYKKYNFAGDQLSNVGLHYNYTFQNVYFYGEAARSFDGGWAILQGAMASISARLSAVFVYRSYDKDYHNFFSQSIGEASGTANEKGAYLGINYSLHKHWKFALYFDYFKFPWLRYRVDAPSSGYEILSRLQYQPTKKLQLSAWFKTEQKQQNPDTGNPDRTLEDLIKTNYRLECNWQFNKKFKSQQRLEVISYQKGAKTTELGYLIYQDLHYSPLSSRLSGNVRLAYFHTDSYNSRIYAYEDDVLSGTGSGGYHGKGIRTYLNLRYRLLKPLDLWARYAIYIYQDKPKIGTGLDEIAGNKKSDLKLQVRYQF